jgi:HAMP domain-containing protein
LKLGTKLTVYLSLIIVLVLSGYGYFHILSRREILFKKMKVEVESTGRSLKVSLEKVQIHRQRQYVQDLIDAIEEYEKTLGIIVYHQGKDLVYRSRSLEDGIEPYLELVKRAIQEDLPKERFGVYKKAPIFAYAFPLKDKKGKNVGGVSILQHASFMEEDIRRAEWNILLTVLILIGAMVAIVLMGTRKWISEPISRLIVGINRIAKGHLDTRIDLRRKDEISQLAEAFNQMAVDLKRAQQEVIQQSEKKVELERSLRQSGNWRPLGNWPRGWLTRSELLSTSLLEGSS